MERVELAAAWARFQASGRAAGGPVPPPVLRSWERCAGRGLLPGARGTPEARPLNARQTQLLDQARPLLEDLHQFIEGPGFAAALADAHGEILDVQGDPTVVALAAAAGLLPRVLATEERIGTNALDLALREALPAQTCGAEHYCTPLHPMAIAAAPIFAVAGHALGALAVITRAESFHPHTLGITIAAVQALQLQFRTDDLIAEAQNHLAELQAALEVMSEGLIFVGQGGEVRRINSRAGAMLGISPRAAGGRLIEDVLAPPPLILTALHQRQEIAEHELIWQGPKGPLAVICTLRQVWDRGRRHLGALITLRPTQSVRQLVQRVVGNTADYTFSDIVGQSPPMLQALHQARLAANASGCVLIRGETGVGRNLFAQAIHNASGRAGGPFVRLNCGTVPRAMLPGELFGVEGAADSRPGKLELADGGTLYLEEVSALPFELQTSLLRTVEMRRSIRAGGSRAFPVDVRIIAADDERLDQHLAEGRFRPDLAARLSSFVVEVPPLRLRGDDLLVMIDHTLRQLNERLGRQAVVAPEALQALLAYPWPGNVRELELALERALEHGEKPVITLDDLPGPVARTALAFSPAMPPSLADSQMLTEREAIVRAGRQAGGHLGRAARILGVSRATLWRKMVRYGLSKEHFWRDGREG